jgi:xylulokinase
MTDAPIYIGIDLGTGGARCVAVDEHGAVVAASSAKLTTENSAVLPGHSEQQPTDWIAALDTAMAGLMAQAPSQGQVAAIAVDSTSGTVLAVDADGAALTPALLHNDMRSTDEAEACSLALGTPISPTFSLAKILWLRRHAGLPDDARFVHATDFINEWLCGKQVATDFTNAMKTGVDLENLSWPEAIESAGVPLGKLPKLCRPGEPIGTLREELASKWGLPTAVMVAAGATDSNAGFYASGAAQVGEWCTTIGTTLAIKGLAETPVNDPDGCIYNHRHPDLHWLPGGASNAGGEILRHWFESAEFADLDAAAATLGQTEQLVYPSVRSGERLPIADAAFQPFHVGSRDDTVGAYLACLEGVGFVERWVYERLAELGAPVGDVVFTSGGAARSDVWLQLRADILQKTIRVAEFAESAMGAAILAAAGHRDAPVGQMSRQMVRISRQYQPTQDGARITYLTNKYNQFREQAAHA